MKTILSPENVYYALRKRAQVEKKRVENAAGRDIEDGGQGNSARRAQLMCLQSILQPARVQQHLMKLLPAEVCADSKTDRGHSPVVK